MWRGGGVVSGGIGDERGAYHVSLLGGLSAAAASAAASLLARVVDFLLCNETVRNCEKKEKKGEGAGSTLWLPSCFLCLLFLRN